MTKQQHSENQVVAKQRHKHAELLRAIADGEQIEIAYESPDDEGDFYSLTDTSDILEMIASGQDIYWVVAPQPKPDIINKMFVEAYPKLDNAWNTPNLELTFDGETQKLKSVRVLDAA